MMQSPSHWSLLGTDEVNRQADDRNVVNGVLCRFVTWSNDQDHPWLGVEQGQENGTCKDYLWEPGLDGEMSC